MTRSSRGSSGILSRIVVSSKRFADSFVQCRRLSSPRLRPVAVSIFHSDVGDEGTIPPSFLFFPSFFFFFFFSSLFFFPFPPLLLLPSTSWNNDRYYSRLIAVLSIKTELWCNTTNIEALRFLITQCRLVPVLLFPLPISRELMRLFHLSRNYIHTHRSVDPLSTESFVFQMD